MADDDLDILAWTMLGEAGGEGTQGMADVGHVVLNRVNSGKYGASIQDVALAPKQFSTWNSGAGGNDPKGKYPKDSAAFKRARQIAEQVVAGTIPGPPGKPLDYNAPSVSPYWASSKAKHGTYERNGHVFYPSVPVPPGELPEVASALSTVPTPRNTQAQAPSVPKRRPDSLNGLHPFDASTNTPRPNADGSVSTEVTRTVQLPGGEWVNVPSLWWGQGSSVRDFGSMGDDQLADFASRYEKSTSNAFPRYASIPEAERAAIARSNEGGGTKAPITYPGNLVDRSFAQLSKPQRNLGDEIGMSPIPGGQQQAPMFDAGFDTRTNAMRLFSNGPADTQGVFTGASKAPAPVPRMPSPQLAGQRANDPALQTALNARYPAQLPPMGPATRSVPTTTIRPSASDKVRGNPMQTMEQATTIASIPTAPRPNVSASDLARGRSGISTIASYPTTGFPTTEQIKAATPFGGGGVGGVPDRLPSQPMLPGLPPPVLAGGNMAVHQVASPFGQVAYQQITPTRVADAPRIAPVPFMRPTGVGTQLSVQPMPPMPIARPGIGGPVMQAPQPMPAAMSPLLALRRSIPAMFTPRPPTSPAAKRVWMTGFSDSGSSGGAHGGKTDDNAPSQWSNYTK